MTRKGLLPVHSANWRRAAEVPREDAGPGLSCGRRETASNPLANTGGRSRTRLRSTKTWRALFCAPAPCRHRDDMDRARHAARMSSARTKAIRKISRPVTPADEAINGFYAVGAGVAQGRRRRSADLNSLIWPPNEFVRSMSSQPFSSRVRRAGSIENVAWKSPQEID